MSDEFIDRTYKALGYKLLERLRVQRFCIVGNGGIGANFAEMLVRSGATKISLIDGSKVEESNLNRTFSFTSGDIRKPKAEVLRSRLQDVRLDGVFVNEIIDSFRTSDESLPQDARQQEVLRREICYADVVFIVTDTNKSRVALERLCRANRIQYASCGVYIDATEGIFEFECAWNPTTPPERENDQGYGPENASYAAIVMEATSVMFAMLLNYLSPNRERLWSRYLRTYNSSFCPIRTCIEYAQGNVQ